jgi:predicted Fe-Mo cluster-binding NifX family protein
MPVVSTLSGCEVVIASGMGRRAIAHFQEVGIKPVFTDVRDAEQAVHAYANDSLETCEQPECGRH